MWIIQEPNLELFKLKQLSKKTTMVVIKPSVLPQSKVISLINTVSFRMLEFKKKKQIKTKTRKTDKGKKKERKKGGRGTETKYGESWRGKKLIIFSSARDSAAPLTAACLCGWCQLTSCMKKCFHPSLSK